MIIQDTIFGSHEVCVLYKQHGEEDPVHKVLFEGTLQECHEYMAVCQVNKEGDT